LSAAVVSQILAGKLILPRTDYASALDAFVNIGK
jgi:hypothetical protein